MRLRRRYRRIYRLHASRMHDRHSRPDCSLVERPDANAANQGNRGSVVPGHDKPSKPKLDLLGFVLATSHP
jgi:hypothetical protein